MTTATPSEQPTDLRERLAAASEATRDKHTAWKTEKQLRNQLVRQAIDDEGMSWRAVQKHTGLTPGTIREILAKGDG